MAQDRNLTGTNTYSTDQNISPYNLNVGVADGTGTLTINGGITHDLNGFIGRGNDGFVSLEGTGSWANDGSLTIGYSNSGTLVISDGGQAGDDSGNLGSHVGSSGNAIVSGTNSSWTSTDNLEIGSQGTGAIAISAQGKVNGGPLTTLGQFAGGSGNVTIMDANSSFTTGTLNVGQSGTGTFTVSNGASASTTIDDVGENAGSSGMMTVTGTNSVLTNTGTFTVGDSGNGTLAIRDSGSVLSGTNTYIGLNANSSGTVTVMDTGSTLTTTGTFMIGASGSGTLAIGGGASVTGTYAYIGTLDSGSGVVTVSGTNSTWTNSASLVVGQIGIGKLTISAGGSVTTGNVDANFTIGGNSVSSGTVIVQDAGSALKIQSEDSYIGYAGTGKLFVMNGGSVTGTSTWIGSGGTGAATVTGPGSHWSNSSLLEVGYISTGTLTISDGGSVSDGLSHIGYNTGASGIVTVTGPNSSWTNTTQLIVGLRGTGVLTISDGGSVSSSQVVIVGDGGNGTLNIGAAAGDSALAAGTLNATSVILGNVGGQGEIVFNHTDTNYIFSSNIAGTGPINVLAGTTILTGTNNFRGGTVLSGGTLVAGSATALGVGNVTINNGSLEGGGTGPATIVGNYTQNGGNLVIHVTSPTASDQFAVQGSAQLGGDLVIDFSAFTNATKNISYTILTAQDGITGTFTDADALQTIALSPTLKAVATIDSASTPEAIIVDTSLTQLPFATLPGAHLTSNQFTVASNIDTVSTISTNPGFQRLIGGLNTVSANPSTFGSYLNQLTPLNFANFTSSTAFNNASFMTQAFDGYLANHRGADGSFVSSEGGLDYSGLAINDPNIDTGLQSVRSRLLAWSPAPGTGLLSDSSSLVSGGMDMKDVAASSGPTNLWNVFVTGNVVLAQNFSDANLPYSSSTTGAMQIGADYKITPHWLIGATFGYGHTHADLDNLGSNANVNTYSPGIYSSYSNKGWYINALGSYGFSSYSQNRNVAIGPFNGTASSSPGGEQIIGNLDGGYDFHRGNWTFGPTLGLQYTHLNVDGYSETGLPGADLNVNRDDSDSLRSRLGGQVSYTIKTASLIFTPHLSASWQHEFMDQSRGITSQFNDVGAGSFFVDTANPSRDSALADVGLDAQVNNSLTVFTDYSVQAGQSNYFGQSVQAGVKIGF